MKSKTSELLLCLSYLHCCIKMNSIIYLKFLISVFNRTLSIYAYFLPGPGLLVLELKITLIKPSKCGQHKSLVAHLLLVLWIAVQIVVGEKKNYLLLLSHNLMIAADLGINS